VPPAASGAKRLATGALEVFTVESSIAYYWAVGALEVFAVDPPVTTYKRATGALGVFIAE